MDTLTYTRSAAYARLILVRCGFRKKMGWGVLPLENSSLLTHCKRHYGTFGKFSWFCYFFLLFFSTFSQIGFRLHEINHTLKSRTLKSTLLWHPAKLCSKSNLFTLWWVWWPNSHRRKGDKLPVVVDMLIKSITSDILDNFKNLMHPSSNQGVGLLQPPRFFLTLHKNEKATDPGLLGNLFYIFCPHLDEKQWGYTT